MNEQRISLDMAKKYSSKPTTYVGRGDVAGTTVVATVTESGVPVDMGGMDVSLRLPLGDVPCAVSGDTATVTIDETLVPDGTEHAYLTLDDGDHAYSTQRFRIVTIAGYREA